MCTKPRRRTVPFVAPTIEIVPGETVRVTLHNKLPAEPDCAPPGQDVNTPNCFNRTNLHSHGLWISPTGNGDNVLLSINPGVSFQYEYNVRRTIRPARSGIIRTDTVRPHCRSRAGWPAC